MSHISYLPLFIFLFLYYITHPAYAQRQLEKLNRGLVAVRTDANHVYIGWRLFGSDPESIAFNIYRNNTRINNTPINGATNYVDQTADNAIYFIRPVINNVETQASETVSLWKQNYLSIPLHIPPSGTTPDGVSYTYLCLIPLCVCNRCKAARNRYSHGQNVFFSLDTFIKLCNRLPKSLNHPIWR